MFLFIIMRPSKKINEVFVSVSPVSQGSPILASSDSSTQFPLELEPPGLPVFALPHQAPGACSFIPPDRTISFRNREE